MKLAALREYIKRKSKPEVRDIEEYLRGDLMATIRELRAAFNRLTFEDNFNTFITTVTIPAATEAQILNKLRKVPSYWIALKKDEGGLAVCDGDTANTSNLLYLKNTSATLSATITVAFFA